MFKFLKRPMGLAVVAVAAAALVGAYAFTASNTIADPGQAGIGTGTITGYAVSNVTYTIDSSAPATWSFVNFDLSADATQVQVKLDDSNNTLTSSGWVDCTAGSSTIQHVSPWHVHCQLPSGVDSGLDTLTVAASR
jgi:polyisoprenoid-binding protein YceI